MGPVQDGSKTVGFLAQKLWDRAQKLWDLTALIRPLLAVPARERTRGAIVRYLAGEEGRQRQGDDHAGDAGDAGDAGGANTRRASRASVERYLRAYEGSGGDIRFSTMDAKPTTGQDAPQPGSDATEMLRCIRCAAATQPTPRVRPKDEVSTQCWRSVAGSGRLR